MWRVRAVLEHGCFQRLEAFGLEGWSTSHYQHFGRGRGVTDAEFWFGQWTSETLRKESLIPMRLLGLADIVESLKKNNQKYVIITANKLKKTQNQRTCVIESGEEKDTPTPRLLHTREPRGHGMPNTLTTLTSEKKHGPIHTCLRTEGEVKIGDHQGVVATGNPLWHACTRPNILGQEKTTQAEHLWTLRCHTWSLTWLAADA